MTPPDPTHPLPSTGPTPKLRVGDIGLASDEDRTVSLAVVEELRKRVAAALPQTARLYLYAAPLASPGEEPTGNTRLRQGELLLEISGASGSALATLLGEASKASGLLLSVVSR